MVDPADAWAALRHKNRYSNCQRSFTVVHTQEYQFIPCKHTMFLKVLIKQFRLSSPLPALVLGLGLATHAAAEIYTCKDSAGHVLTSDRPIPECANKSTQVFTNNGTLKTQFSAPLTSEQRHAAESLAQRNAEQVRQQQDLERERRFLAAHYPNEASIELARQKQLKAIVDKMAAENQTIKTATDAVNHGRAALQRLPANQPTQRMDLQQSIDALQQTIRESDRQVQEDELQLRNINRDFDLTRARYLELMWP